ncbi:MAG: aminotransferase class V-fold PLP-dependent enzyme [Saprospiraceae bacterium]|nr:aminotransferase class V-fold PLP-dependent enzyme [Saprospiraceae bacterium]
MQRRNLFKYLGASALGLSTSGSILKAMEKEYTGSLAFLKELSGLKDDDFWAGIRSAYSVNPTMINLNNGGVAPSPRVVQEALDYYNRMCNDGPSYYMWRVLDGGREPMRKNMAEIAGCDMEELAFNRNSSEALETIIFGLRLNKGDEVVLTKQDYPNMINAWKQREKRDGIVLKWINFDFPIEDKKKIIDAFSAQFTPRTKVVHITHAINWNGQLLPAREIADVARKNGIEVLVDAAHSFAHFPYKIKDLNCDYFGTSLHKWLSAPIGSGLLYVRKEKIKNLYPLLASADSESTDIRKFESLGTRSLAIEQAIANAIDFYRMIGPERKFDRLFELKTYWTNKVIQHPKVKITSPLSKEFSGAIANVSVLGKKPNELADFIYNDNRIHSVAINWENINSVRITPNVYTSLNDLDKLVESILKLADTKD